MGLFGKGKKERVVDLTPGYKRQQEKSAQASSDTSQKSSSNFGFLGNLASSQNSSTNETNSGYVNMSESEDKKKKLGKMLMDLTKRIEDLSNQIYHLKQRIELLEKKLKISFE